MTPERMAGLVARWVRFYTRSLAPPIAGRRRDEIDADLHDHIAHERARGTEERRIALGIAARDRRAREARRDPLDVLERGPDRLDRGLDDERMLELHGRIASSSSGVSTSSGRPRWPASTSRTMASRSSSRAPTSPRSAPTRSSSVRDSATGCPARPA
jgi:hypothetical protein